MSETSEAVTVQADHIAVQGDHIAVQTDHIGAQNDHIAAQAVAQLAEHGETEAAITAIYLIQDGHQEHHQNGETDYTGYLCPADPDPEPEEDADESQSPICKNTVSVTRKKRRGRVSKVWDVFQHDRENNTSKCKFCGATLAYNGGTSSMRKHLMHKHVKEYCEMFPEDSVSPGPLKKARLAGQNIPTPRAKKPQNLIQLQEPFTFLPYAVGLPEDVFRHLQANFEADPKNLLAQNISLQDDIQKLSVSRIPQEHNTHVFNTRVPVIGKPRTHQKDSGTCWIFACMNAMRIPFMHQYILEEFEFSQTYLFFWDKLERCNYMFDIFVKCSIKGEKPDGRVLHHLLQRPIEDAGQWDMLVNLIEKYGVVPKACFPLSPNLLQSRFLSRILNTKMADYCCKLQKIMKKRTDHTEEIQRLRDEMLQEMYNVIAIAVGSPPVEFTWDYYDKDKNCHRVGPITPLLFYTEYVKPIFNMEDKICLVNDPRDENPYQQLYTVEYIGNVVNGRPITYINQPIEVLKAAAATAIRNGEPVWFGSDAGKFFNKELGFYDLRSHDYKLSLGVDVLEMTKGERLRYLNSMMYHAMLLFGVNIEEDGSTSKWEVEDSYSDIGMNGQHMMTDEWFTEFVYEVVIDKKYLTDEVLMVLEQSPRILPPWDPMGTLAR